MKNYLLFWKIIVYLSEKRDARPGSAVWSGRRAKTLLITAVISFAHSGSA